MEASRIRTGALMTLGMTAAVGWYFMTSPQALPGPAARPVASAPAAMVSPPSTTSASEVTPTTVTAPPAPPIDPVLLTLVDNTTIGATISWHPVAGAAFYSVVVDGVYVGSTPEPFTGIPWKPGATTMSIAVAAVGSDGASGVAGTLDVAYPAAAATSTSASAESSSSSTTPSQGTAPSTAAAPPPSRTTGSTTATTPPPTQAPPTTTSAPPAPEPSIVPEPTTAAPPTSDPNVGNNGGGNGNGKPDPSTSQSTTNGA